MAQELGLKEDQSANFFGVLRLSVCEVNGVYD
jgi:hypothetical protein